jgi:hypothetical protein
MGFDQKVTPANLQCPIDPQQQQVSQPDLWTVISNLYDLENCIADSLLPKPITIIEPSSIGTLVTSSARLMLSKSNPQEAPLPNQELATNADLTTKPAQTGNITDKPKQTEVQPVRRQHCWIQSSHPKTN